MKRLIACLMSLVLAIGLVPASAFALMRASVSTQAEASATFEDVNLYDALVSQLAERGIPCESSRQDKTVVLTAQANAQLTTLDLSFKNIKSIAGLEAFTSLTWLDLSHNQVSTTAQFGGMTHLEHLNLYDNAVRDFSGLEGLSSLTYLNLGDNNEVSKSALRGLSALDGLTKLTYLDFSRNNEPTIVDHIGKLTNLEFLNLQQNGVTDIAALANMSELKELIAPYNSIAGVSALGDKTKLEVLNLQGNQLYSTVNGTPETTDRTGIDGLFDDTGALKLPALRKLELYGNWNWSGFMGNAGAAKLGSLFALDQAGSLELGYCYDRVKVYDSVIAEASAPRNAKLADLPRRDAAGLSYVTYDDFGAWCDGVHDDFNAIRNAHRYANANGCEVRANPERTYHVFRLHDMDYYPVYTNVDWQGANFIIHDEGIDGYPARSVPFLCLSPSPEGATTSTSAHSDIITIPNPPKANPNDNEKAAYAAEPYRYAPALTVNGTLGKTTRTIAGLSPEIDATLAALNAKGYDRYYVQAYNAGKRQYIRFGSTSSSDQWDGFIVGGDGALERTAPAPVQWDFDTLTKVVITPIPQRASYIRNGNFVANPLDSLEEAPYSRGSKPIYYLRNLQIQECANLEISHVTHSVGTEEGGFDNDELSGSYTGFFQVRGCADVDMHDCTAWARRYAESGRSTYGISLDRNVDISLTRVNCSNPWRHLLSVGGRRWGVTGTDHNKHVLYDHCTLNRIDAHEGYYDLTVRNCTLGDWGFRLTGQGPLVIDRCDVYADSFITLRKDYGSTWDGDARITNCTHHYYRRDSGSQNLIGISASFDDNARTKLHDFGYDLRHPNLYVSNLTVDEALFKRQEGDYLPLRINYGIVSNFDNDHSDELPASYWPDVVKVDGLHFTNYGNTIGFEPHVRVPLNETGAVMSKAGNYTVEDVTYEGAEAGFDISSGDDLLTGRTTIAYGDAESRLIFRAFDSETLGDNHIAIEYSGARPELQFVDSKWRGWARVMPYYCVRGDTTNTAFFSNAEIKSAWADVGGSLSADDVAEDAPVGALAMMEVKAAATTTLEHVVLCGHRHVWGEWTQKRVESCTEPGLMQRTCALDGTHVDVRETEALGHDWDDDYTVDVQPTTERAGSKSIHCKRCDAVKDTVAIPKLAAEGEGDASGIGAETGTGAGTGAGTGTGGDSRGQTGNAPDNGDASGSGGQSGSGAASGSGSSDDSAGTGTGADEGAGEGAGADTGAGAGEGTGAGEGASSGSEGAAGGSSGAQGGARPDASGDASSANGPNASDASNGSNASTGSDASNGSDGSCGLPSAGNGAAASGGESADSGQTYSLRPSAGTVRVPSRPVFSLVRDKTGQRRYTASFAKVRKLLQSRWRYAGIAFYAPANVGKKVRELKRGRTFVYAVKSSEVARYRKAGFKPTGTAFRSLASGGEKVYRLYCEKTGAYALAKKGSGMKALKKRGWVSQGACLRAVR